MLVYSPAGQQGYQQMFDMMPQQCCCGQWSNTTVLCTMCCQLAVPPAVVHTGTHTFTPTTAVREITNEAV